MRKYHYENCLRIYENGYEEIVCEIFSPDDKKIAECKTVKYAKLISKLLNMDKIAKESK